MYSLGASFLTRDYVIYIYIYIYTLSHQNAQVNKITSSSFYFLFFTVDYKSFYSLFDYVLYYTRHRYRINYINALKKKKIFFLEINHFLKFFSVLEQMFIHIITRSLLHTHEISSVDEKKLARTRAKLFFSLSLSLFSVKARQV